MCVGRVVTIVCRAVAEELSSEVGQLAMDFKADDSLSFRNVCQENGANSGSSRVFPRRRRISSSKKRAIA